MPKADDYRDELRRLRRDMEVSSLGDRPCSMSAMKLQRLIELEAAEIRDYAHMSLQPERRYTLAEVEQLASDYCNDATSAARLEDRLRLSLFIQHLKKREREVGDAGIGAR